MTRAVTSDIRDLCSFPALALGLSRLLSHYVGFLSFPLPEITVKPPGESVAPKPRP